MDTPIKTGPLGALYAALERRAFPAHSYDYPWSRGPWHEGGAALRVRCLAFDLMSKASRRAPWLFGFDIGHPALGVYTRRRLYTKSLADLFFPTPASDEMIEEVDRLMKEREWSYYVVPRRPIGE